MPRFSIIVPVYKVEAYLAKCIDSVLAQRCQDFELLLVDDGSPDGCGAICDEYAARAPEKIRVFHQENGGAGAARNLGIAQAQGDYLLFVDGDDSLSDDLLSDLSDAMAHTDADLYLFGAFVEENGKTVGELHEAIDCDRPYSAQEAPRLFFGVMAPWNRAYRRTLFSDIRFDSNVWYEDIRVVTKINAVAQSALRLPKAYYHYLRREGSTMNNKTVARNVEILYAFDDILAWYASHGYAERYRDEICFLAVQHILLAATVRVLMIDRKHPLLGQFRDYMDAHFPDFACNPYLSELDGNKRLIYRLLLKKRYRTVRLIFRAKALLGK